MKRARALVAGTAAVLVLAVHLPAAGALPAAGVQPSSLAAASATASKQVKILVLSNRADLISDGDALAEVTGVGGTTSMRKLRVDVDGRNVTGAFELRPNGRVMGLVTGLKPGKNVLTARVQQGGARITITNHAVGGPIFSGPQIQPWLCTTEENGLGPPQDAQCNAPTDYEFFYMPSDGGGFQPYDPDNPPADVGTTTTDQGETVPYVIRQETGTQNRGIYRIAVLYDPEQPFEPWADQPGWNHKLAYPFGASCGTIHSQSDAQDVQDDLALSRGFMVATSSMNVLGNNCNTVTSAESVTMLKERIAERYGQIRYTIGNGCSGGSIGQHVVSNAYPGLVDGIQPTCSFTDSWSTGLEVGDCHLLLNYFNTTSPGLWGAAQQRAFVSGHATPGSCAAWDVLFSANQQPRDGCGLPDDQMYDPDTNPTGCRGATRDFNVSIVGRRPQEIWTPAEHAAGFGFASWSFDNIGIQYGLEALRQGRITTEQFVDLNEKIGGANIDYDLVPERRQADPGSVKVVHGTGLLNDGRQLDRVPIVDLRPSSNAEIHTDFHSYAMRERLIKANGHADNQIIWTSPVPLVIPPAEAEEAFLLIDRWLAAIEADTSADPLEVKVVRNKPADAVDACWINDEKVTDMTACRAAYPYYGAPRIAAGGPLSHDVFKCRLRQLDRGDDYGTVPFTDPQWARLQAAFPTGVCDWSRPSVDKVPSVPWLTYKAGPGGKPLGPPPSSKPF